MANFFILNLKQPIRVIPKMAIFQSSLLKLTFYQTAFSQKDYSFLNNRSQNIFSKTAIPNPLFSKLSFSSNVSQIGHSQTAFYRSPASPTTPVTSPVLTFEILKFKDIIYCYNHIWISIQLETKKIVLRTEDLRNLL